MRYSNRPGPALATILIISAIDVLLCSFTAALTLFFFSPSTGLGVKQTNFSGGFNLGGALDGARVIIRNDAGSDLQYTGENDTEIVAAKSDGISVLRLKALPSIANPVWLGTRKPCVAPCQVKLAATVYLVPNGSHSSPKSQTIACVTQRPDAVAIINTDDPIKQLCENTNGGPSPETQDELTRLLVQASDKRRGN
jgi:hypothetical protein